MKILINGDSWGKGEWGFMHVENTLKDPDLPGLTHRGLEHYFKEKGYVVDNISQGGSSNLMCFERFKKLENKDYDYIFWFQTDFLRDGKDFYLSFPKFTSLKNIQYTWEQIIQHKTKFYHLFYSKLNSYNKKIFLMGGVNRVNLDIVSNYKNIVPIIPCISEFLLPDLTVDSDIWFEGWLKEGPAFRGIKTAISDNLNIEILEKIIEIKENDLRKTNKNFDKLFWPDGLHPNRLGHKIIFDYLCEQLKI